MMNLTDARRIFKTEFVDGLTAEQRKDKIMVNEAYMNYLDALCKDGQLSENKYQNAKNYYKR